MQKIAVSLATGGKPARRPINLPTVTLTGGIPIPGPEAPKPVLGLESLKTVPGIEPYLTNRLIPDLLYLQEEGRLLEAIAAANPANPDSIIFNDKSQVIHQETQKIEIDILTGRIDVRKTDITCRNTKCKAKAVTGPYPQQRRSADEPPTFVFICTKCKFQFSESAA
jgi:DNA-directed RNA polymerase subunit M/transcription elongation factor TFIIS